MAMKQREHDGNTSRNVGGPILGTAPSDFFRCQEVDFSLPTWVEQFKKRCDQDWIMLRGK